MRVKHDIDDLIRAVGGSTGRVARMLHVTRNTLNRIMAEGRHVLVTDDNKIFVQSPSSFDPSDLIEPVNRKYSTSIAQRLLSRWRASLKKSAAEEMCVEELIFDTAVRNYRVACGVVYVFADKSVLTCNVDTNKWEL